MVSNIFLQLINYGDCSNVSFLLYALLEIKNVQLKVPKFLPSFLLYEWKDCLKVINDLKRCETVIHPSISSSTEFS